MEYWQVFAIAIGLGTDAFSVGMSVGTRNPGFGQYFRASFHFGLFQFFMPLLGWLASHRIVGLFSKYNAYIASGILVVIALRMLIGFFGNPEESDPGKDITKGWTLIGLSIATSLDAFGVGLGIGLLGDSLILPCIIIGVVAAVMTLIGIRLGNHLSNVLERKAELLGSIILFAIAIKIILSG